MTQTGTSTAHYLANIAPMAESIPGARAEVGTQIERADRDGHVELANAYRYIGLELDQMAMYAADMPVVLIWDRISERLMELSELLPLNMRLTLMKLAEETTGSWTELAYIHPSDLARWLGL